MKKHLSLAVRLVMAIAGVAFIIYSVDWKDRVEVKPGAVLPGSESPVTQKLMLPVVRGDLDPRGQKSELVVNATPDASEQLVTLSVSDLADSDRYLLRPSLITTLRHARISLLLLGLLLVGPVFPVQAYRWLLLMRCRGIDVSYGKALKLTMVGSFFNFCMPGATGGDLVKAWYAAKNSDRRADAVMSVIFDRVTGLVGIVLFAGLTGFFILNIPLGRTIMTNLWLGMLVVTAGAAVYFSKRLRRMFGIDFLVARLPLGELVRKVDTAAVAYASHKKDVIAAVLLSLPTHLALAAATAVAGYAVGMKANFGLLLTVIPVIFLTGALPITPQGAGVWEAIGKFMLVSPPDVTMNQVVVMLLMIRLYQLAYSLIGSVFLLRGDVHLHPERDEPEGRVAEPVA